MPVMLDKILLIPLALIFLFAVGFWIFSPLAMIPAAYRHLRYSRKGLCPKCHKPARMVTRPVDQTYSSQVSQLVCTCGGSSIPFNDRQATDWAGF